MLYYYYFLLLAKNVHIYDARAILILIIMHIYRTLIIPHILHIYSIYVYRSK